ncbi:MAG: hypothetical protein JNJ44_04045 [Zoogloeaceae bacterium]|nr:hypothetical protein [Zoogloeaceae bacterium]
MNARRSPLHGPAKAPAWQREELLWLLSLSGTMAGLCVTGIALLHAVGPSSRAGSIADDLLATCALLFLLCTYVVFFALRTQREGLAMVLDRVVDGLFTLALTLMVGTGFVMVYTVW